jgi:CubicO group peptidase (beta-lactamase class C family)
MANVQGTVAPGFEGVRDAFEKNFDEHADVGAGYSLYVDGDCVVDLVGGVTEAGGSEPYGPDALQLVFSSTKGATAMCAHILADRGELDFDAPVTEYWPEFGAAGKAEVPVRWLISHRVGLIDVDRKMSLVEALDWDVVTSALAESAPVWPPGTQHGYHAVTYGWLVGEVVRRISGKSLGEFFATEIADPLGLDFWIGTPDRVHDRVVPVIPFAPPPGLVPELDHAPESGGTAPSLGDMLSMFLGSDNLLGRALGAPGGAFGGGDEWNLPEVWRAEIPAANGITNARSLARMYAAFIGEVDGIRLVSPGTLANALVRQVFGPDSVLIFEIPFGLGFMLNGGLMALGSDTAFGHFGAGGSLGFADHERGIAGAYVMNKMEIGLTGDPRSSSLVAASFAAAR